MVLLESRVPLLEQDYQSQFQWFKDSVQESVVFFLEFTTTFLHKLPVVFLRNISFVIILPLYLFTGLVKKQGSFCEANPVP